MKKKSSYISYPGEMGYKFDCILINGQRKLECQIEALTLLKPNGHVVLRKSLLSRNTIARENYEIEEDGDNFLLGRKAGSSANTTISCGKAGHFCSIAGPACN